MDIKKCRAFIASADTGSFTAAGQKLGYTQSGITRMINSLEAELGFDLFNRQKSGVTLTSNGRQILPAIRQLVKASQLAEELGSEIRGVKSGMIALGCYFSFAAILLPQLLKEFEEKYPGIQVNVEEGGNSEIRSWLASGQIDLAICAKPSDHQLNWHLLFKDRLVAWLPKTHPLANAVAYPVGRLSQEDFIHTLPNKDTDQDRLIKEAGLTLKEKYTTRDGFTTYNMVEAGLGISVNQELISKKWQGQVAEVPIEPAFYVEMGILLPKNPPSPAVKTFADFLQGKF